MRTKIAVLAVVLGLIAVQAPSMAAVMDPNGEVHGAVYPIIIEGPNGLSAKMLSGPSARGPVEPIAPTAARVSVNPAEVLPMNANNLQNIEPGMNFVDMQCIKIAPSALLPKGANL